MMLVMRRRPCDPDLKQAREETSAALEKAIDLREESRAVRQEIERISATNGFVAMFTKLLRTA